MNNIYISISLISERHKYIQNEPYHLNTLIRVGYFSMHFRKAFLSGILKRWRYGLFSGSHLCPVSVLCVIWKCLQNKNMVAQPAQKVPMMIPANRKSLCSIRHLLLEDGSVLAESYSTDWSSRSLFSLCVCEVKSPSGALC